MSCEKIVMPNMFLFLFFLHEILSLRIEITRLWNERYTVGIKFAYGIIHTLAVRNVRAVSINYNLLLRKFCRNAYLLPVHSQFLVTIILVWSVSRSEQTFLP